MTTCCNTVHTVSKYSSVYILHEGAQRRAASQEQRLQPCTCWGTAFVSITSGQTERTAASDCNSSLAYNLSPVLLCVDECPIQALLQQLQGNASITGLSSLTHSHRSKTPVIMLSLAFLVHPGSGSFLFKKLVPQEFSTTVAVYSVYQAVTHAVMVFQCRVSAQLA